MIKPQKALHLYLELEKKRTKVADDEFVIFEKYDGWYGLRETIGEGLISSDIMSRAGRAIPSLVGLSASLSAFEQTKQITVKGTIIFEILVEGIPVFSELNGMLNRSKGECECKGAYLMVHDFVTADDEAVPFLERYQLASAYVEALGHPKVRIAPIIATGDCNEVQRQAELIWDRRSKDTSDEGAIGKRIDAPYSAGKRNKDIIKVKSEVTLECVVVGLEEGEGKYVGTLGKLIVQQKNGLTHSVSGMSDEERYQWWTNPDYIKGQVVELAAMQILENGSLREGRFKAVRHDKTVSEID
tara:strand:+ start:336 stop:1235 length:900 start_codon:yes stop_codon:yes gene_type:complete